MVNETYANSKAVIPLYLLATVASFVSIFLGSIFGAIKKTTGIFTTTLFSSIVNVIIINAFIGIWGLQAANISLLMGFLVNIVLRIRMLNKELVIKVDYKFLIVFALLFTCVNFAFSNLGLLQNLLVLVIALFITILVFKEYIAILVARIRVRR